ncbi:MAG: acyl-ACP--UDP-N-acetylglucosamine O-acyltransferase [Verrucomicrobia bacterium]|nr:acyl-ACP--UDP-N-acetylglucosamine O-acyltransferase [Verrucomicrobiota bacterium]
MKIHPSAIVSPKAVLADDVEIGPGVIIGDEVTLGAGCVVQAHAIIEGKTTLGTGNLVGYGSIIGTEPQDFAFKKETVSEVRIGNGNTLREYVTIHRGTKEGSATEVGDGCYLMVGSHLGHNVRIANRVIIANACHLAGYVEVQEGAVLGGGTVFHQFMRVGRQAMVRGGTRFGKDIVPYAMADADNFLSGINVIGLRRSGMNSETRQEIRRAFKLLFRSGLNVSQAVEQASTMPWGPEATAFFDFVRESRRGICPANQRKGDRDEGGESID